jgi:hypothetical protein
MQIKIKYPLARVLNRLIDCIHCLARAEYKVPYHIWWQISRASILVNEAWEILRSTPTALLRLTTGNHNCQEISLLS